VELNIPVFIDTTDNTATLILRIEHNDSVSYMLSMGGVELPIQNAMLNRLLIAQADLDKLQSAPENFGQSSSWDAFRPPKTVDGKVVLAASSGASVSQDVLNNLRDEVKRITKSLTIIEEIN